MMSDETTGAEGTQADPTTQPPEGTTPKTPAVGAEPDGISLDEVRKLRSESKALRDRAKTAEEELEKLRGSTQTEQERSIRDARKEGAQEVVAKVRVALAKVALKAAGITNERLLHTMSRDDAFLKVKITDEGEIEGLDEAVDEFRKATEDLFPKQRTTPGGPWGGAEGGSSDRPVEAGMDRIRRAYESPSTK